ncbi:MAG: O-antigen ligase family protein [Patescibacteria group bacterium]
MSYTTWLRWAILAGIFIVPFIAFVSPAPGVAVLGNMFFPYITGKNFVFRIVVEMMLLCWVILACADPKYRPRSSWLMWAVLAFVAWMAIATVTSVDPIKSFWSNFERMEGYIGLFHLFVWFVITGTMLAAERLWERFFNVSIFASVLMSLYAFLQVTHLFGFSPTSQSGARADTTLGNATYLAVYLLMMIFITLYMLLRKRDSIMWQVLYGLALVLQAMGLYFTETRGAILGTLLGLFVAAAYVALFSRGKEWQGLRRVCIGGLAAIVIVVGGFFAIKDTSFVQHSSTLNRLSHISLTDRSTIARFEIWQMAWKGFQEKPLTGWGQENFNYVFNKYYNADMWDQEQWFDRAHNQFIDWFINGGLPAGLLYVVLYALAAWAIVRAEGLSVPERAVLFGLLAAFAFNNLFVFDNLIAGVYFFALLAFAHSLTRRELPGKMFLTKPMGAHGLAVAAPIIAVVILGGAWALNAPGIARAQQLVDAIQTQTQSGARNPADNIASFKRALGTTAWPGNPTGYQEATEQLAQYASSIGQTGASPDIAQQVRLLADGALTTLLAQRSGDARLELFYGSFLASAGDLQDALAHFKAAATDSPNKQQILIQLGLVEIQAGDPTAGFASLKKAFDLAPEYDYARIMYAAGGYYTGHNAESDKLLIDKFGSTIVDNDQLLSVYMDTKQYARAEAIWKLRIQAHPTDPNQLIGLAQVYFVSGDTASTIATLKEIEKISPSQAAQIEQLISQIKSGALKPGQ